MVSHTFRIYTNLGAYRHSGFIETETGHSVKRWGNGSLMPFYEPLLPSI